MIKNEVRYCNCCGKEFAMNGDMFVEDFLHISKEWGYFSSQDGMNMTADVCEKCLVDWMKNFKYKPQMTERVEL